MSDYLQKIIYLTQAQYNTLKSNGTVEGQTGINDNYLYFITDEGMSASDLSDDFILPVTKGGTGKKQITSGSLLVGNGTAAMTEIAATNVNTANTIVKRDGSCNFSAGTITASLSGNATSANYPYGFTSRSGSAGWGNTTGTCITSWNGGNGSEIAFFKDNPASGQLSIKVDGTVYIKEGSQNISEAVKSFSVSGKTVTYTTLWGNTDTFTTQDTTYANGTGITIGTGNAINHSNSVTAQTTQAVYPIKIDAQGHISAYGTAVTPVTSVNGHTGSSVSVTASDLGLSSALRFVGITTTDMTGGTASNHSYTGVPGGITSYTTPAQGDVVINSTKQDEWVCTTANGNNSVWERLGSDTSYKIVQSTVSDPTASTTTSTTFIDTISQNTNGVITATKKTLPTATDKIAGITKVGASGGAAAYSHTHSYLANTNKGAENRPIYITGNAATECEYMFPIYYKALDFSSTAPVPGAYPVNNETNPATNTTGWYGSALSLPGINASTKHYAAQVFIGSQSGVDKPVHIYVRRLVSSPAWSSWSTVLDNENYNSYAPTLTGDGASGTWNINISGSAGSVAWTNVSGRPTNLDQFTNGPGYVTSSGVTKVSTGAGLTGGDITTTGTISINGMNTSSGATDKWLNQKGEWTTPPNDNTHHAAYLYAGANNATKHAAVSSGTNIYLCLRENGSQRSAVQIKQGSNMTISSDASGIITFAAKDTTYSNFVKSGVGAAAGLVPSPGTTAGSTKYLREDGTWAVPPDTKYTLTAATTSALGGIQLGYSENGKNYPVELSNNKAFVNVPWTDTNNAATHTLNTAAKYYVTGTTSASTSTSGDTFDTGIYATTIAGQLNAKTFKVNEAVTLQYNTTDQSLEFIF